MMYAMSSLGNIYFLKHVSLFFHYRQPLPEMPRTQPIPKLKEIYWNVLR